MSLFHHPRRVMLPHRKLSSLEIFIAVGAVVAACLAGVASRSFLPL